MAWQMPHTVLSAVVLQGGFLMGGDYVKHSFPLATSMTLLAWSLLRLGPAYKQVSSTSDVAGISSSMNVTEGGGGV
jgi:hypothetical protein